MGVLGLETEKGLYLGIDFGTTNSVVSIYRYDGDEIITVSIDGSSVCPSAIQFEADPDNKDRLLRAFGIQAKEAAMVYPDSTVLSIKRILGTDENISIEVAGKSYSFRPEDIVSEILAYLKAGADAYIRDELMIAGVFEGCVITVPANSTDKQKKRTKDAAVMAGFSHDRIYLRLEPAAAAIAYAINQKEDRQVMIYDFGGGTFDACILRIEGKCSDEPQMRILGTDGDNHLGGNDLDQLMVDWIYNAFVEQTGGKIDLFDLDADDGVSRKAKRMAVVRLHQVANQAKEKLSTLQTVKIVLAPFLQEPSMVNLQLEISRDAFMNHKRKYPLDDPQEVFDHFEGRSALDLIRDSIRCVQRCLDMSDLKPEDIDEVFLVGGTSMMPQVGNEVANLFGKPAYQSKISPALSISNGAAYYCSQIMSQSTAGPKMLESTIHPIGLEISGRRFLEVVKRGVTIPPEGLQIDTPQMLETNFDGVTSMVIAVYEDTAPEETPSLRFVYEPGMKRLGGTTLRGIPAGPKGEQKVKIIFQISQDNMLHVEARSVSNGGIATGLSVDQMY